MVNKVIQVDIFQPDFERKLRLDSKNISITNWDHPLGTSMFKCALGQFSKNL